MRIPDIGRFLVEGLANHLAGSALQRARLLEETMDDMARKARDAHVQKLAGTLIDMAEQVEEHEAVRGETLGLDARALRIMAANITPPSWEADTTVIAVVSGDDETYHRQDDGMWDYTNEYDCTVTAFWHEIPGPVRVVSRRYTDTESNDYG